MDQLKFKDLAMLFDELKKNHSIEEILEMPIYIGDDDELNGIHCATNYGMVSKDDEYIKENNFELKDKAILIS